MSRRKACVIGWPIAHSRSPLIHRYWLKRLAVDGDYTAVAVEPERIAKFFIQFADSGFIGGNVTVPHKEAAFRAVDEADEVAAVLGAVNTLWLQDGRLLGSNTDVHGFLANLDGAVPGWSAEVGAAMVLGAGGAARAVIWSLLQRGFDPVVVVNRTLAKAEQLARNFGPGVRASGWDEVGTMLPLSRVLVNTTSLGMRGQPSLPLDLRRVRDDMIVNDLVYVPLETGLLERARDCGLSAVDGLGMLLHQAVPGFEKWFGQRPEVSDELRSLIVADLARDA